MDLLAALWNALPDDYGQLFALVTAVEGWLIERTPLWAVSAIVGLFLVLWARSALGARWQSWGTKLDRRQLYAISAPLHAVDYLVAFYVGMNAVLEQTYWNSRLFRFSVAFVAWWLIIPKTVYPPRFIFITLVFVVIYWPLTYLLCRALGAMPRPYIERTKTFLRWSVFAIICATLFIKIPGPNDFQRHFGVLFASVFFTVLALLPFHIFWRDPPGPEPKKYGDAQFGDSSDLIARGIIDER